MPDCWYLILDRVVGKGGHSYDQMLLGGYLMSSKKTTLSDAHLREGECFRRPKTIEELRAFDEFCGKLALEDPIQAVCNLRWMLDEVWMRWNVGEIAARMRLEARRLNIPSIGDEFVLKYEWKFDLYHEWHNHEFFDYLGIGEQYGPQYTDGVITNSVPVTLPAGMGLKVYRIYIRRGKKNFDSITFIVTHDAEGKKVKRQRFWAKLSDINTMVVKIFPPT
jgi:hypothetical protein